MNSYLLQLKASASIAMMDRARQLKAQGYNVISLAGGEPDFDTPTPIMEAGIRAIRDGRTHYTTGRGILTLRERIAQKLNEENSIVCGPDSILVTPGGKYAIYLCVFCCINPGDEVMILDPSWVSYAPMVEMVGGKPVKVPLSFCNNYSITDDLLERYCTSRTRILILNTPNNPTGRVLTAEESDAIRTFMNTHRDVLLIADEVYEKIIFDGRKHISMGSLGEIADRVITVNSFSKSAAMTGWRIGYLCASKSLVDAIYLCYQHTLTCISEFSQIAAVTALDCHKEMEQMRESYARRRDMLILGLQQIPQATCLLPEGAFYAWCRFDKDGMDSDAICEYLLEKAQVVCVSGNAYGLGSERCVRMCFASADRDIQDAVKRIEAAMK